MALAQGIDWGDGGDGSGRNRLGALLMQVRELRAELRDGGLSRDAIT